MAGAICGTTGTLHCRAGPEMLHMTAERPLINGPVGIAIERHAEMLQFDYYLGRLAAEKFDCILITQPVGSFDGVVHVPHPAVFAHIAKCRTDAALCRNRVRSCGKNFRQHRDLEPGFRQLKGSAHTGPASANDYRIEFSHRQFHVSEAPENLNSLEGIGHQDQHDDDLQTETYAGMFDVIHQDVPHADPRMPKHAKEKNQRGYAHELIAEQCAPLFVTLHGANHQHAGKCNNVYGHDERRYALCKPVFESVMRACNDLFHHNQTPTMAVRTRLTINTAALVMRVARRSPATWTSSSKNRTPAKKWCKNDHNRPTRNSFTSQLPVIARTC